MKPIRSLLLSLAILFVPLHLLAEDESHEWKADKATMKKLKAMVESGDLSKADAKAKWADLKKAAPKQKAAAGKKAAAKKLKALVKAGDLTEAEAKAKWHAMHGGDKADHGEAIGKKLKALVESGDLTEEEAKAKWAALIEKVEKKEKKEAAEKPHGKKIDWADMKRQIEQAVQDGDITRAEADEKYKALKSMDGGTFEEKDEPLP